MNIAFPLCGSEVEDLIFNALAKVAPSQGGKPEQQLSNDGINHWSLFADSFPLNSIRILARHHGRPHSIVQL